MTLQEFIQDCRIPSLSHFADAGREAIHVNGASVPLASMMVAQRFFEKPGPILVVAKDYKNAEVWMENLQSLVGEEFVRFFPSIGLKPYEQKVPFEGVVEERLRFFRDAGNLQKPIVAVCPLDALLMKLPKPGGLAKNMRLLKVGDVLEPSTLRPWFLDHGFSEQPVVSSVGEFSIRGCIVDVNCFLYPHPIRIEFFGDEIESIRSFDIFTQRSVEAMERVTLYPMGEWTIPDAEVAKYNGELAGLWWNRSRYERLDSSLLDYLPGASLVFEELSSLAETASRLNQAYNSAFEELRTTAVDVIPSCDIWWKFGEISATFPGHASMDITHVEADASNWYSVQSRPQDFASAGTEEVAKKIEDFYAGGGQVYVVAPTPGALARLKHVFTGLPVEDYFVGNLTEGFWLDDDKVAFLTETRIFKRHATKSRKRQIAGSVTTALMVESLKSVE